MTPAPDATSPASQVDYGGLIERLEKVECSSEPSDWSGIRTVTTNWHRNPDGPEAARAIRDLEAENARLREDARLLDRLTSPTVDHKGAKQRLMTIRKARAALSGRMG